MSKWQDQIRRSWHAMKTEALDGGTPLAVHFVGATGQTFDSLMSERDNGNALAIDIINAIQSWFRTANAAYDEGVKPSCVACDCDLDKGQVAGWIVFRPIEMEKSTGITGVFCLLCAIRGADHIHRSAAKLIERDGLGTMQRAQ
jgi:hypothetical protein